VGANETKIEIVRLGRPVGAALRTYKVYVDGHHVGRVWRNRSAAVRVAPGLHRVQLRIDWAFSPELEVLITEGAQVTLLCRPAGGPLHALEDLAKSRSEPTIDLEPANSSMTMSAKAKRPWLSSYRIFYALLPSWGQRMCRGMPHWPFQLLALLFFGFGLVGLSRGRIADAIVTWVLAAFLGYSAFRLKRWKQSLLLDRD